MNNRRKFLAVLSALFIPFLPKEKLTKFYCLKDNKLIRTRLKNFVVGDKFYIENDRTKLYEVTEVDIYSGKNPAIRVKNA